MAYQHPLAYLLGMEGLALLRAWAGDHDEEFVSARLAEVRRLLDDPGLAAHPGVTIERDATQRAYQQWAPSYDDEPRNGLFDLDEPVFEEILGSLSPGVAVDAACGTGRLASVMIARGYQVVGVDGSVDMLDRARHLVPGLAVAAGDLADLPLPDSAADLVVCGLALTHVSDLTPAFSEFARVLRPGGDLVISDVHPDLVLLGSVVTAIGPDGQPQQAATYRHAPTVVLRTALAAGFGVLRCEEESRPEAPGAPPGTVEGHEPTGEHELSQGGETDLACDVGQWEDWPWSLLGIVPEAVRAAWTSPSVIVWHLRLA